MSTFRELISNVRGMHKLFSGDSRMSNRLIASEIKIASLLLIKRDLNLRKLWATDTIFTTIPCLEMIEVSVTECCDFCDPCTVARSKHKLPPISEGNYQYVIQGVYTINAMSGKGKKLKEITVNRYQNLLKLPIIKNEEYFWISNDYLYVNNPFLKAVRLVAFFEDDVPNEILYPQDGVGCPLPPVDDYCKNPLDKKLTLPGYLEKQTLDLVTQKLLNTYFRIKTDMTVDSVDGQAPNTKPTN